MSQFAVHANADATSRKLIPCFLDVQSDLIETLGSRVVVPLISRERAGSPLARLMPCILVDDRHLVMDTPQIMGIPLRMLGKHVADASGDRDVILAAIDMLTHGI